MMPGPWEKYAQSNPWERFSGEKQGVYGVADSHPVAAFEQEFTRGIANNILAIPRGIGNAAAAGAAGIQMMAPGDQSFSELYEAEQERFPANALRFAGSLTGEKIAAGIQTAPALVPGGETPQEAFRENLAQIEGRQEALRQANPIAAKAGEIVADVISILGARAPVAGRIRGAERILTSSPLPAAIPEKLSAVLDATIASKLFRMLARGAGRAVEAGFEGALIDMLDDNNPLETGVYAASAQAAQSGLLGYTKMLLSGGSGTATALGGAAFMVYATNQYLESLAPGDRNQVLNNIQDSFDRIAITTVLGAVSGLLGGGRLSGHSGKLGTLEKEFPVIMESIGSAPRAAVISTIKEMFGSPPETRSMTSAVLQGLISDPSQFGDYASELQTAFMDEKFVETVERLYSEEEGFRSKVFSLAPPELQAPRTRGRIQR